MGTGPGNKARFRLKTAVAMPSKRSELGVIQQQSSDLCEAKRRWPLLSSMTHNDHCNKARPVSRSDFTQRVSSFTNSYESDKIAASSGNLGAGDVATLGGGRTQPLGACSHLPN